MASNLHIFANPVMVPQAVADAMRAGLPAAGSSFFSSVGDVVLPPVGAWPVLHWLSGPLEPMLRPSQTRFWSDGSAAHVGGGFVSNCCRAHLDPRSCRLSDKGFSTASPARTPEPTEDSPTEAQLFWLAVSPNSGRTVHARDREPTRSILNAVAAIPDTEEIVEIGAGDLALAGIIAEEFGLKVVATDIRPAPPFPKTTRGGIEYVRTPAESLPFGADRFGGAVACRSIVDYAGIESLRELFRVLKPNGTLTAIHHFDRCGLTVMNVWIAQLYKLALATNSVGSTIEKANLRRQLEERIELFLKDERPWTRFAGTKVKASRDFLVHFAVHGIDRDDLPYIEQQIRFGELLLPTLARSQADIEELYRSAGFQVEVSRPVEVGSPDTPLHAYAHLMITARKPRDGN